ncbi:MAG: hypothetical protein AAGU11_02960 [Syntrophobacteraceae bacterium]
MSEKIAEIIETLEVADRMFNGFDNLSEEAKKLWSAGIERLAAAIWVHEHGEQDELEK